MNKITLKEFHYKDIFLILAAANNVTDVIIYLFIAPTDSDYHQQKRQPLILNRKFHLISELCSCEKSFTNMEKKSISFIGISCPGLLIFSLILTGDFLCHSIAKQLSLK